MYLAHNIFYMFIFSFIINMIIMPLIMTYSIKHITFSLGKFYASIIMGLLMVLCEIGMYDIMNNTKSINQYVFYTVILLIYIYMYRYQIYINDKGYLKEMKEHHSMALLTSSVRLKRSNNKKIKNFANHIFNSQQKEINYINNL